MVKGAKERDKKGRGRMGRDEREKGRKEKDMIHEKEQDRE